MVGLGRNETLHHIPKPVDLKFVIIYGPKYLDCLVWVVFYYSEK